MKIDAKELTQQIKIGLQDLFDATVTEKEQTIKIVFHNGQEFLLKIVEK